MGDHTKRKTTPQLKNPKKQKQVTKNPHNPDNLEKNKNPWLMVKKSKI